MHPSGWQNVLIQATSSGQNTGRVWTRVLGGVHNVPPVAFALLGTIMFSVVTLDTCKPSENLGQSSKGPRESGESKEQVYSFEGSRCHFVSR